MHLRLLILTIVCLFLSCHPVFSDEHASCVQYQPPDFTADEVMDTIQRIQWRLPSDVQEYFNRFYSDSGYRSFTDAVARLATQLPPGYIRYIRNVDVNIYVAYIVNRYRKLPDYVKSYFHEWKPTQADIGYVSNITTRYLSLATPKIVKLLQKWPTCPESQRITYVSDVVYMLPWDVSVMTQFGNNSTDNYVLSLDMQDNGDDTSPSV